MTAIRDANGQTRQERWRARFKQKHGVDYTTLWFRLKRGIRLAKRNCDICGKLFQPYRTNSLRCGRACHQIEYRLKKKGLD